MSQYINPASKLFYHNDRIAAIKAGQRPAPVNVEIDLSNRCSLGCSWCHFAYTHTKGPLAGKRDKPDEAIPGGDLMDYDLLRGWLPDMHYCGVKSITWTGGGEPTLHPKFANIVRTAAAWNIEQGLYTHGGHIDDDRAALLKQKCTWVYVSLDECDRESYKRSKGVDRFDAVLCNIERLVHARGSATVGVGFLLHTSNCDRVDDMVALGKALGVDYVQFRPIIHYDQTAPGQQIDDVVWVNRAINNLRKHAGDKRVIADTSRFEMYRDWRHHGYTTCYWSALQAIITPNGKVWRCANKREHADALLGDLTVESFTDIWARAGGPCQVNEKCRVMCRGHLANLTLDAIMTETAHGNFI